jgi:hypothetical protein
MTERDRTLAFRRPHAARDRLQADPMFVHRPDFERSARVLAFLLSDGALKFFLSVLDRNPWTTATTHENGSWRSDRLPSRSALQAPPCSGAI